MCSFESLVSEALSAPFVGWDFGWLAGRSATEPLPWSYAGTVGDCVARAGSMLDMGTGGGEVLSRLRRAPLVVATEAWPPNVPVAAGRLRHFGIPVVQDEGAPDNTNQDGPRGRLPFRDRAFDLVTNRHEAFRATEVARVLAPAGTFVTQQVDFHTYDDFFCAMGLEVPAQPDSWLPLARSQVEDAGLEVLVAQAGEEVQRFDDIGAVIYYLNVVAGAATAAELTTLVDVEAHYPELRTLHDRMQREALLVRQRRFLLVAAQPRGVRSSHTA